VIVSLLVPGSLSFAAPITIPTSLLPGAQYRLAFVTAGTLGATSASIADYDAFVTAQANTEASLSSISWQVIGSTAAVAARDHTGTDPANYPGVPIFLLNDVKLVDNYADLWDGTLDIALNVDQHGNLPFSNHVWTGSTTAGLQASAASVLGAATPVFGLANTASAVWVVGATNPNTAQNALYAISAVLTVPAPEPGAIALLTPMLTALLVVRRRTR
jgi:hypothetical protein